MTAIDSKQVTSPTLFDINADKISNENITAITCFDKNDFISKSIINLLSSNLVQSWNGSIF